jgi:hypothetical protein
MSETGTNRKSAQEFLASATGRDIEAAMRADAALIGIGYSLLDVADAIRDQTARQVPLADVEAALMRVATAPEPSRGLGYARAHVAEHAAPEPE